MLVEFLTRDREGLNVTVIMIFIWRCHIWRY